MTETLEPRVEFLEAARSVDNARVHELENWRRRDEPRIEALATAAIAAEARKAVEHEFRARAWSRWQKTGAGLAGAIVAAGGLLDILRALGGIG